MIPVNEVVDLSRLQFALTALYHFLLCRLRWGFRAACHDGNRHPNWSRHTASTR